MRTYNEMFQLFNGKYATQKINSSNLNKFEKIGNVRNLPRSGNPKQ